MVATTRTTTRATTRRASLVSFPCGRAWLFPHTARPPACSLAQCVCQKFLLVELLEQKLKTNSKLIMVVIETRRDFANFAERERSESARKFCIFQFAPDGAV